MHYARFRRHGDLEYVGQAGRPLSDGRMLTVMMLREDFGSLRTIDRYYRGIRILRWLDTTGAATEEQCESSFQEARKAATRPNGTFNVSRFLNVIETRAAPLM